MPLKTPAAADELGVTYHQLVGLLRFRKMPPPGRDSSGDYLWTDLDLDLERARVALSNLRRRKKEVATA